MKVIISLIFGLFSGWAVTNTSTLTPDAIEAFIGSALAGSNGIQSISAYITPDAKAAKSVHTWIIFLGLVLPIITFSSLCAFMVARWSNKVRCVVYASLIYLLYRIFAAAFFVRVVSNDENFSRSLANIFNDRITEYVINIGIYFVLFYLLLLWSGKRSAKVHSQISKP